MFISQSLLSTLSFLAKSSPRLRQTYDLRNSEEDNSQRMLNALEPGTVMPIHRHRKSSETVVIVRGSLVERFYDEEGNVTEEMLMVPGGESPVVQVEKGRWHSLECLESGTVLFEAKDGKYEPIQDEDIMKRPRNSSKATAYASLPDCSKGQKASSSASKAITALLSPSTVSLPSQRVS